jgi:two-component system response regulator TrcR
MVMEKIKVLLVEDEEVLAMVVRETLEGRGFNISTAANGVAGWSHFNHQRPDICVLDIMMPRKDGLSLLADIRLVEPDLPVIMLTAKVETEDVLRGLELGADDYMKKPFSMEELILRIKRLTRRHPQNAAPAITSVEDQCPIGRYAFNPTRLELSIGNKVFNLSQRESDVLQLLAGAKNQLLDKRTALIKIWGEDTIFNSRSMDVYITRLRKCLALDTAISILNIRGKGYKLVD